VIIFGSVWFLPEKTAKPKKKRPQTEPEPAVLGRFRSGFLDKKQDKPIGLFWALFGFLIGFLMGFVIGF
jgi:RsiW-degrading membrane proteinase PrsW (M82 family)